MKKVMKYIGLIIAISIFTACLNEKKFVFEKFIEDDANMLVCPVHILANDDSSTDTISSNSIVDFINEKKYANAELTLLSPPAYTEWKSNEAKMLTESMKLFIKFVETQNIENNTYVLYVEFLKSGETPSVKAVHYCLLNNVGEIAMRGLVNSNWEAFQEINPKTNSDCVDVFKIDFEEKMN